MDGQLLKSRVGTLVAVSSPEADKEGWTTHWQVLYDVRENIVPAQTVMVHLLNIYFGESE